MDTNLAKQMYDSIGEISESTKNGTQLLQSFMINNNADIIKALDYISNELHNANSDRKKYLETMRKRYENLMFRRLTVTEDLFSVEMGPSPNFDKTESEDAEDRGAGKKTKAKKDTKTIQHPASKNQKTLNDKLGEEKKNKSQKKELSDDEKAVLNRKGAYNQLSQLEQDFCDKKTYIVNYDEIIKRYNEIYLPKIQKALNDNDRNKARMLLKLALRCSGPGIHYLNDTNIEKVLDWIKSEHFEWKSIIDFKDNPKPSIADLTREVENRIKAEGLGREEAKKLVEPYLTSNIREKDLLVTKGDEKQLEDRFNSIFNFMFDKEFKVENQPKSFDRENVKKEMYDLHKEKGGKKAFASMASNFHKILNKHDNNGSLKDRKNEMLAFIKKTDKAMYDEIIKSQKNISKPKIESKDKTNEKETKVETKETTKKEKVVFNRSKVKGEIYAKYEGNINEKTLDSMATDLSNILQEQNISHKLESCAFEMQDYCLKQNPELFKIENNEVSPNIDISKFKTQCKGFKEGKLISEYLLTLLNKKPGELSEIVSRETLENIIIEIAKDSLLSKTIQITDEKDTSDWTDEDIATWVNEEVFTKTDGFFRILSATSEEEFTEDYKHYINEFPAGQENERYEKLKEVLNSSIPRTTYTKKIGNKVRKGASGKKFINEITTKINAATPVVK